MTLSHVPLSTNTHTHEKTVDENGDSTDEHEAPGSWMKQEEEF